MNVWLVLAVLAVGIVAGVQTLTPRARPSLTVIGQGAARTSTRPSCPLLSRPRSRSCRD
ncbi:MAG: hypothetical protein ABSH51_20600 [Solirubrobacteraceae bacterium]